MTNPRTIMIDDEKYVMLKDIDKQQNASIDGLDYAIVCCAHAGIFAGYISKHVEQHISLIHARRIKYWDGAASITQLAMGGTNKPENCLFTPKHSVRVLDAVSVTLCTEKGRASIEGVKDWVK